MYGARISVAATGSSAAYAGLPVVQAHTHIVGASGFDARAELAREKVDRAVILDGDLDAEVAGERRDLAQNAQKFVDVLLERDRPEAIRLRAKDTPDDG